MIKTVREYKNKADEIVLVQQRIVDRLCAGEGECFRVERRKVIIGKDRVITREWK